MTEAEIRERKTLLALVPVLGPSVPVGLFSLADTFAGEEDFGDAARAHSSFYAVRAGTRLDREILRRIILRASKNK
jgi:hypothetical protein